MSKPIKGLVFRLAKPKTKRVSSSKSKLSLLVYCTCIEYEGEFRAMIKIVSGKRRPTNRVLPFTPESYSCRGKERVFTKKKDKNGKRICYIRTPTDAMIAPSKPILYTPFCEDWVYSGYIVRINGEQYFDIKEPIWHKDFCQVDLDIPAESIKL